MKTNAPRTPALLGLMTAAVATRVLLTWSATGLSVGVSVGAVTLTLAGYYAAMSTPVDEDHPNIRLTFCLTIALYVAGQMLFVVSRYGGQGNA